MTPTAEEFFANYSPDVRAVAMQARQLVLSVVPDATEHVDTGNKVVVYATGGRMAEMVSYISAHKAHVNIGLRGADLPDPAGLMEGTGKQLRHVKLRTPEDVNNPALRALLETALAKHLETTQKKEAR